MISKLMMVALTLRRKKVTILIIAFGLFLSISFSIQFISRYNVKTAQQNTLNEERDAAVVEDALLHSINVKFIETAKLINKDQKVAPISLGDLDNIESLSKLEQPTREELLRKRAEKTFEQLETEQQLGIPYISYDIKKPYVPKQRIVHFDLKGAPPLLSYYKKIFPIIKSMGATGVLLEYEDMFPYSDTLKNLSAKNAYTVDQIKDILELAEDLDLEVIPVIQTFGHLEFALKHSEFSHLREVPGSPQSLCPSRNSSLDFIREVVTQIMNLHPKIKYLHIGCDEVFEMGECEVCRQQLHEQLFLKHIHKVANLILEKYPNLKLIMWDDMLRHLSQQMMIEMEIGNLVEPMLWVYAEDIYRFIQPLIWDKYAAVFRSVWAASAFKGAFGETLYVPNAKRHLENNLRWIDVMSTQSSSFKNGISGIAITGWQRYDHFSVLCELIPAALPSLALNLIAVSHGYFNSSLKDQFLSALSCPQQHTRTSNPFINLDSDPFLWDKLGRCMFPGNAFFRFTYRLHNTENEVREFLDVTQRQKGWMTAYNVRHNYSLPLRVDELTQDLPRIYHGMISLAKSAVDAMMEIFDHYTITEWIEQRIYPYIIELEKITNQSRILKSVKHWPSRPLAPLTDLERLGISVKYN